MKLVIGSKNFSSWSLRPWLLLKHFDIFFEEVLVPLYQDTTAFRIARHSKAGKVPILKDKATIWDSLAICEYISENYLEGKGWPKDSFDRAVARSYANEMHSGFFAVRESLPFQCHGTLSEFDSSLEFDSSPELERDIYRIDQIWQNLSKEHSDKGDWLFGDFSIVDCMYAPVAIRFSQYDIQVSETSKNYISNVLAHPAIIEWFNDAQQEQF